MDIWFQQLRDFYKDNPELAIALAASAGAIFTKLLPMLGSFIVHLLTMMGHKIGGRFAYKNIQDHYLNWVALTNQDLNLTGIVGSGEKPKLEQVFISLKVVEDLGEQQSREEMKVEDTRSGRYLAWKPIIDISLGAWTNLRNTGVRLLRMLLDKIWPPQEIHQLSVFRPSRVWRLRLIWERDGLKEIIGIAVFFLFWAVIPIYGLLILPTVNNFIAGYGTAVWCLFGILIIVVVLDEIDPKDPKWWWNAGLSIGIFTILPSIFLILTFISKVIHESQSPLAMGLGATLGLLLAALMVWGKYYSEHDLGNEEQRVKEVGRLLSAHDNIAILGKPGAGKSTYTQYMALTFAQDKAGDKEYRRRGIVRRRFGANSWFLPIPIPLRKISQFVAEADPLLSDNLLIEAFRQKILPADQRVYFSTSYVRHMLQKKKCLFLLDGLDEVADDAEFQSVVKEITGLVYRFPGNKIVVTSRYAGWRGGLGSSFQKLEVDDLTDDQITSFITSWYKAIEMNRTHIPQRSYLPADKLQRNQRATEKADALNLALRQSASVRRLAENPLLLSIICFVHYHKILPKERLSLYQDCSNLLLDQWDREKGLPVDDTNLNRARKEAIMQEIAFALHSGKIGERFGGKEFTRAEITPLVASMMQRFQMDPDIADALFQKLVDRSGIIVVVEKYKERYAFSHLTFQEFYTAKYLHENRLDIFALIEQLDHGAPNRGLADWWREVVLLYSTLQRDASQVIERLCANNEKDFLNRQLQIAAQCLSEATEISNYDAENSVLTQVLFVRSGQESEIKARLFKPEIKDYLFRYATSSYFLKDVLSGAVSRVQSIETVEKLSTSLIQTVNSVDRGIQLSSIDALIALAKKNDISQTISFEILEPLLPSANAEVKLAAIKLALSVLPYPVIEGLAERLVDEVLGLIPQEMASRLPIGDRLCDVLEDLPKTLSRNNNSKLQQQLAGRLRQTFHGKSIAWKLCLCVTKTLIRLDRTKKNKFTQLRL